MHVHSVNVEAFTQKRRFPVSTPSRVTLSGLGSSESICKFLKVCVVHPVRVFLSADRRPGHRVSPTFRIAVTLGSFGLVFEDRKAGWTDSERDLSRRKTPPSGAGENERCRVGWLRTIASSVTAWWVQGSPQSRFLALFFVMVSRWTRHNTVRGKMRH